MMGAGTDRLKDSVEFAYRALRSDILSGALAPGAVLSQVQLAERFEISRTPLREALRRLLAENLVVGDFNRRTRVSELNLDDFDQIYAMRIALEPIAIGATLGGISAEASAALRADVDAMDAAIAGLDLDTFRAAHRAFHLGLTASTGGRMGKLIEDLWDDTERYRIAYLHRDYLQPTPESRERMRVTQEDHRAILDAALSEDVSGCGEAHVHHLHRALDLVYAAAAAGPRVRVAAYALRLSSLDDHERAAAAAARA